MRDLVHTPVNLKEMGGHTLSDGATFAVELNGELLVDDPRSEVETILDARHLLYAGKHLHRHGECTLARHHEPPHKVTILLRILLDALGELVTPMSKHPVRLTREVCTCGDVEQVCLVMLLLPHLSRASQCLARLFPQLSESKQIKTVDHTQRGVGNKPVCRTRRSGISKVV